MNYKQLKALLNQPVNLWPRPVVMPEGLRAQMQWLVYRVDRRDGVVELRAPSGHALNLADVIHHYQKAGNTLVLDAQLIIRGHAVEVEPRPWGATTRTLHQRIGAALRARPL